MPHKMFFRPADNRPPGEVYLKSFYGNCGGLQNVTGDKSAPPSDRWRGAFYAGSCGERWEWISHGSDVSGCFLRRESKGNNCTYKSRLRAGEIHASTIGIASDFNSA